MIRLPPKSTRTYTLFPYTTLFRSIVKLNVGGKRMDIRRSTATHFDDTPLAWICGGLWDFMLPKDMHGELCESCSRQSWFVPLFPHATLITRPCVCGF